jgi:hypothetical protein
MKLVVAAVIVVVAALSGTAFAQDSKKGAAELLFNEGQKLLDAGKVAEACAKFEASQKIDPAIGTLLNLARCYESAGRTASAWQTYVEAEKLARSKKDKRADGAKKRAKQLEGKVPTLVIEVPDPPEGLSVTQGGQPVDPALFGIGIPVDPGTLAIEATAPGYAPFSQSVEATEGASARVEVRLEKEKVVKEPDVVVPPTGGGDEDEDEEDEGDGELAGSGGSPGRGRRILGIVVAGAGVVALGGSTVLILGAKSDYNAAFDDGLCDRQTLACTPEGHSATSDARNKANIATVVGAVGVVAVAAGVVLFLTAPHGGGAAEHAYIVPVVDGDQLGLAFGGSL